MEMQKGQKEEGTERGRNEEGGKGWSRALHQICTGLRALS